MGSVPPSADERLPLMASGQPVELCPEADRILQLIVASGATIATSMDDSTIVHRHSAISKRCCRDQLDPPCDEKPTLIQGRAVAGNPGVDEEPVLIDQIQPIERGGELPLPRSTPAGVPL